MTNKIILSMCLTAAFVVGNSHAKVITIEANGFHIENTITTDKSPEQAWAALIKNVGQWWPSDHTWWGDSKNLRIDSHAGGCFCETSGEASAEHMRISFVDPGKLLRMTGGLGPLQGMGMFGALDWQISVTEEDKTEVKLTYRVAGLNNPEQLQQFAPIVDKVQGIQLQGLGDFLNN